MSSLTPPGMIMPSGSTSLGTPGVTNPVNSFFNNASIQRYRNVPVINRISNLFSLRLLQKNKISNTQVPVTQYFFPISPTGLTKTVPVLNEPYAIRGSHTTGGVQYDVDIYGQSPPIFSINGTTGWQYHSTDGNKYTGLASFHQLQKFFQEYHFLVLQASSQIRYTIEFYDYFNNEFWEVIPIDKLIFQFTEAEPLFGKYGITLLATKEVKTPISKIVLKNPVSQALGQIVTGAVNTLVGTASSVVNLGTVFS